MATGYIRVDRDQAGSGSLSREVRWDQKVIPRALYSPTHCASTISFRRRHDSSEWKQRSAYWKKRLDGACRRAAKEDLDDGHGFERLGRRAAAERRVEQTGCREGALRTRGRCGARQDEADALHHALVLGRCRRTERLVKVARDLVHLVSLCGREMSKTHASLFALANVTSCVTNAPPPPPPLSASWRCTPRHSCGTLRTRAHRPQVRQRRQQQERHCSSPPQAND